MQGLANLMVFGSGFAGAGAVAIAGFELIRSEPDKAFKLLEQWGPWFFLALFVAWIVYKVATSAMDAVRDVGCRIADSLESQASSMQQQALAIQKSADKDDRQAQEMQTLTALTAQRSEKTYSMMQAFHEDNQMIAKVQQEQLRAHSDTLLRIEQKVDLRLAAMEKATT